MKTMVAIPCMDMINTQFMQSVLNLGFFGECQLALASGSLVYDARNQLAEKAVDEGFDRVLWLDSDMTFQPDMFKRFHEDLDEGRDFVSGLYVKRKVPIEPVIYSKCEETKNEQGRNVPVIESYKDYPRDSIFDIQACGFGAVMMNTSVIKTVMDHYGLPFYPAGGFGEDLIFCYRARMQRIPIYCDSRIKCGHIGYYTFTEETYQKGVL